MVNMKKILTGIAAFTLSAALITGCGSKELDMTSVANEILSGATFAEQLQPASENIALKRLGINAADVESCVAYASTNAVVDEFAVVKATNAANVESAIRNHIAQQSATYSSYAPNEVPKLDNAVVKISGDYVIYVVSSDNASAQALVDGLTK